MSPQTHIELDANGEPMVSTFDKMAYVILSMMLKVFFYVVPFTFGLNEFNALMESPFMRLSAIFIGFCFSVISWLTACLIPWFVFGVEYDFATEVFHLYRDIRFNTAMAFVFVLLLLSRFLTRSILRTVTSYRSRKYIFIVLCITNIACIASTMEYVGSSNNPYVFLFNFSVTGIIFLLLMRSKTDIKKTRTRPRGYSYRYNH